MPAYGVAGSFISCAKYGAEEFSINSHIVPEHRGQGGLNRCLIGVAGIACILAILIVCVMFVPAKRWVAVLLPEDTIAEGVSGTLRNGRIQRLVIAGVQSGPWHWQLRSLRQLDAQLGEPGQAPWSFTLSGSPWSWRLQGEGGDFRWWQTFPPLLGKATGQIRWFGEWGQCMKTEGGIHAETLLLMVPYPVNLGSANASSTCTGGFNSLHAPHCRGLILWRPASTRVKGTAC
jgi:hypothetical protein